MRRHLTQTQRAHELLRRRGKEGVTAACLLLPDVADGGPPITRLASRIDELRSRGLDIVTTFEQTPGGARVARYVLREAPATVPVPVAAEPDHLLAPTPRSAVLGWDEAAA